MARPNDTHLDGIIYLDAPSTRRYSRSRVTFPHQQAVSGDMLQFRKRSSLERNVVVDVGVVPARRLRGSPTGCPSLGRLLRRPGGLVPVVPVASRAPAPAQHLEFVRDDLGGVAILSVLSLPLPGLDPAFDIDLRTLAQVLLRDLGQAAEQHHPVPFRPLAPLVGLAVGPALVGRDAQIGDGAAARAVAGFGIGPEIADENDLVDASCHASLLQVKKTADRPCPPLPGGAGRWRHCAPPPAKLHPDEERSGKNPLGDEPISYAVPPLWRID